MVDECHLSFEWGKHFRTDYANIHEVRQYLGCPLGLFTATLSHVARSEVISNTGLKKDMAVVSANPDRPEIFLELRKREDFEKSLDFVVSDCQGKGRNASKTLVFVNSINKTHNFNFNLRRLMHDKGRVRSDEGKILGYISEHFSSVIDPKSRNRIIKDFSEEDGIIRTLFSTVSYGLGIDNPFINTVVIYDTDKTKSSLWQKISRGCRGGQNGKAIILSTSDKPRSNSFFKPDICMRHTILSGFAGYKKPASHPKCEGSKEKCGIYMCCSTCRSSCKCEEVMVVEEVEDMNFTQSHFQPSEYPSHGQYENFGIGHSHYENIFD